MSKPHAIIIGGTSGLGRQIAIQCLQRGITPIILGRNVARVPSDPELAGAHVFELDLTNTHTFYVLVPRLFSMIMGMRITHIFWVAGTPQRKPFLEESSLELVQLIAVHLQGPVILLKVLFEELIRRHQPIHLAVVSSTSAIKQRTGEEAYCMVQAGKAMFASQIAGTLRNKLPGSEVTLFMPGGMDTPFWTGDDRMTGVKLMDPAVVARIIARETLDEHRWVDAHRFFRSLEIARGSQGEPIERWRAQTGDELY